MSKFEKVAVGLILVVYVAALVALVFNVHGGNTPVNTINTKSVEVASEYNATTSAAFWANTPKVIATSTNGSPDIRTLGSIIIGTTDATIVEIKDATSSTDVASTTIAIIAASPAVGSTMTFDYAIKRGLIINTTAAFSAGRYTITWR